MARGFSKAIITGNLVADPEQRSTGGGLTVASFAVAVNEVRRDKDGNNTEYVSFLNCTAFGRQAETICQYMKKGNGILVSGRLRQDRYEDKQGNKRSGVEIIVEDFNFLGGRSDSEGGASYDAPAPAAPKSKKAATPAPADDFVPDDIPMDDVNLSDIPF